MAEPGGSVWGEDEEWWFDYEWEHVKIGVYLWCLSGWQRMPTQDEVLALDPKWFSDLQHARKIMMHQANKSPMMQMLEGHLANENLNKVAQDFSEEEIHTRRKDTAAKQTDWEIDMWEHLRNLGRDFQDNGVDIPN